MKLLDNLLASIEGKRIQRMLYKKNFDVEYLQEQGISVAEIVKVRKYIEKLQHAYKKDNIWHSGIVLGGETGTRYLLHEVIERRTLLAHGINITDLSPEKAEEIWRANSHYAHKAALKAEILYLQKRRPSKSLDALAAIIENDNQFLNKESDREFLDEIIEELVKK